MSIEIVPEYVQTIERRLSTLDAEVVVERLNGASIADPIARAS